MTEMLQFFVIVGFDWLDTQIRCFESASSKQNYKQQLPDLCIW